MERSGPTSYAFRRAGWRLALREGHRRSTCCYAKALYASRLTSGLAGRWRRRCAQLDRDFVLYASRRRLRAWPGGGDRTGSLLSTPPAVDFGSGPEAAAAAGRAAGRRCFFLRLAPPTSGLARRGRRRGAQLDGSLLSKPRAADFGPGTETAAEGRSAGWGARCLRLSTPTLGLARRRRWRGGLPWPGVCFSFIHSPASRREVQLCSVTGPNTI